MYEGNLDGSEEDVKKSRESWLKCMAKMSDTWAEIVLWVEDSQLTHMWERDRRSSGGIWLRFMLHEGFQCGFHCGGKFFVWLMARRRVWWPGLVR